MNLEAHSLDKFSSSLDHGAHLWLGFTHNPFTLFRIKGLGPNFIAGTYKIYINENHYRFQVP